MHTISNCDYKQNNEIYSQNDISRDIYNIIHNILYNKNNNYMINNNAGDTKKNVINENNKPKKNFKNLKETLNNNISLNVLNKNNKSIFMNKNSHNKIIEESEKIITNNNENIKNISKGKSKSESVEFRTLLHNFSNEKKSNNVGDLNDLNVIFVSNDNNDAKKVIKNQEFNKQDSNNKSIIKTININNKKNDKNIQNNKINNKIKKNKKTKNVNNIEETKDNEILEDENYLKEEDFYDEKELEENIDDINNRSEENDYIDDNLNKNFKRRKTFQEKNIYFHDKNNNLILSKNHKIGFTPLLNKKEHKELIKNINELRYMEKYRKKILYYTTSDLIFLEKKEDKELEDFDQINGIKKDIKSLIKNYFENLLKVQQFKLNIIETLMSMSIFLKYRNYNENEIKILDKELKENISPSKSAKKKKHIKTGDFGNEKIHHLIDYPEIKKENLIYDNSYLFKNVKGPEGKIKNEVLDLINSTPNNDGKRKNDEEIFLSRTNSRASRKSHRSKLNARKRKFKKIEGTQGLTNLFKDDEDENVGIEESKRKEELENLRKKEEIRDKKLYEFFARVQRLKYLNENLTESNEEFNNLIDMQIQEIENDKVKIETRINNFMQNFKINRMKYQSTKDFVNKKYIFTSPIKFSCKIINC